VKRPDESGSRDTDLEERLARYDGWIQEGKIPTSSKVIPVHESLSVQQWVVPTEQVLEFLRNARVYALIECVCRSQYQRCDNPLEVCFVINDVADQYLAEGNGRRVSLEEAEERLQNANERGLVHLTIYNPDQHVFAVCSCCSCCCHDLQFLKLYGRGDLIAHSEYVAQTDSNACVHCGECVNRCVFEARVFEDGQLRYDIDACYGCGLCVTVCPEDATVMRRRER
jgi:Pyruvate/2-oxoacid:ferredoxin oxidoreductase delta subunit